MPSDSGDHNRRLSKAFNTTGAPPPEQEQIPCPRCDSTNTKFCYYNNYNFSQPRHFCKGCRRYWTQGGTLRDIPVGGGTRKSAKRSRTNTTTNTTTSHNNFPLPATSVLLPISSNHGSFGSIGGVPKGNGAVTGSGSGTGTLCGSFSSLLNNHNTHGHGFLGLGGFGLGTETGVEDVGFGLGRGMWPFGDGATGVGNNGGASTGTWQFEGGETGFVGVDCFSWPDLAISTPGNGLK